MHGIYYDKEHKRKFDPKIIKRIFVEYATNNTYRVYIPKTEKIKTDCDVKFDESRNGCKLLKREKKEEHMINKRLTIVGLESDDNEIIENQEKIQEYDQKTVKMKMQI